MQLVYHYGTRHVTKIKKEGHWLIGGELTLFGLDKKLVFLKEGKHILLSKVREV